MSLLSERAQQSSDAVNRALAFYRLIRDAELGEPHDTWLRPSAAIFPAEHLAQDVILRLVAIAEDLSMNLILDRSESVLPSDPRVGWLWEREFRRSGESWEGRVELWTRIHSKPMSGFAEGPSLRGFVEARNAIAHGLGQLTRRQMRDEKSTLARLRNAGIHVRGDTVELDEDAVERCAAVVRAFIAWLDS